MVTKTLDTSIPFIDYHELAQTRYTDNFRDDPIFDAIIKTITDVMNEKQKEHLEIADNLYNIDNNFGYGLDAIGRIVKQPRILTDFHQGVHFGFKGSYKSGTFGTIKDPSVGAVFYSALSPDQGSGKILSDVEYKNVLKARVISNSCRCTTNELIKIIDLLSFSNTNSVSWNNDQHGVINISISEDKYGILNYFLSRQHTPDNILTIQAGYRLEPSYVGE